MMNLAVPVGSSSHHMTLDLQSDRSTHVRRGEKRVKQGGTLVRDQDYLFIIS